LIVRRSTFDVRRSAFGVFEEAALAKNTYKNLEVWKLSIDLVEDIYRITKRFPTDERFVLVPQMRRCAISIPSNIAEGQGRSNTKEFLSFLSIARGSLRELETQLTIAVRLKYVSREEALPLWETLQRIAQMLPKLMDALRSAPQRRTPNAERRTVLP
jgi:four helix bundle protein